MPAIAHGGMNSREDTKGESKKIKKEVEHIRISEAKNEGHIAESYFTSYEHTPEKNVFATGTPHPVHEGHLFHHLAKHLHIPHTVVDKKEEHEPDEEEEIEKVE